MGDAKAVVVELLDRLARLDERALELVADGFVNHANGPQGRDGVAMALEVMRASDPGTRVDVHHLLAEGDLVTVHTTVDGSEQAAGLALLTGATPAGASSVRRYFHLLRIAEGRVAEHWACRDDASVLPAYGSQRASAGGEGFPDLS